MHLPDLHTREMMFCAQTQDVIPPVLAVPEPIAINIRTHTVPNSVGHIMAML
jgi:hypothetical protein